MTGLSVTLGRISPSAFHSDPLNLRKPNREISGSPSKNKNKVLLQLPLPFMGGESKPQCRFSVSFAVVRRGFTVAFEWDGHHSEQAEKGKRIIWAEKYTHFRLEFLGLPALFVINSCASFPDLLFLTGKERRCASRFSGSSRVPGSA